MTNLTFCFTFIKDRFINEFSYLDVVLELQSVHGVKLIQKPIPLTP